MDRSSVEVVRSTYDALNRRDLTAMLEALAPTIEYRLPMDPLHVHPVFRGHAGVRELYERLFRSLDGYRVTLGSVHDLGRGVVVATGRWHARLAANSGSARFASRTSGRSRTAGRYGCPSTTPRTPWS